MDMHFLQASQKNLVKWDLFRQKKQVYVDFAEKLLKDRVRMKILMSLI